MNYLKRLLNDWKGLIIEILPYTSKQAYLTFIKPTLESFSRFRNVFKLLPIIWLIGLVILSPMFLFAMLLVFSTLFIVVLPYTALVDTMDLKLNFKRISKLFKQFVYNKEK